MRRLAFLPLLLACVVGAAPAVGSANATVSNDAESAVTATRGTASTGPVLRSGKRKFRRPKVCAERWGMWASPDQRGLHISPTLGGHRNRDADGNFYGPYLACLDQFTQFRPTIRGEFRVRVTWLRGGRVIKRQTATRRNGRHYFGLDNRRLRSSGEEVRLGGKRVTAKVRFSKPGYRTRTFRIVSFSYPNE